MAPSERRSSILNIDNWLDKCPNDEPDSIIYDPDYVNEVAVMRTKEKMPNIEALYKTAADICTKIGLAPQLVEERLNDIDDCMTLLLNNISKDLQDEYEKLCEYKQGLINQIDKILNDLHLPPYVPEDNMTLLQYCKRLKVKFNELDEIKQKRLTRLQQLKDRQINLCHILGIEPPKLRLQTDIPSDEELFSLSNAVLNLEKEERRRLENYNLVKTQIKSLVDLIEHVPETEFERAILTKEPCLTEAHIAEMLNYKTKLEAIHAQNKEQFEKLNARLVSLFDRLKFTQEERMSCQDCKPSTLAEMEVEIERCEALKRQNIGAFIDETKKNLVDMYARCYLKTDENQENFFSLSNVAGECNDELLELYEQELERVNNYYKTNEKVFEKFRMWDSLFEELKDSKEKVNDPVVRKNRGGILDQILKRCRQLERTLPNLHEELKVLSENNKLEIYGSTIDEYIEKRWNELQSKGKPQTNKPQVIVKRTPLKRAAGAATPTPSKLQCKKSFMETPTNNTYRSNQTLTNSAVKKPNFTRPTPVKKQPVLTNVNTRNWNSSSSNKSEFSSGLSLSEQDFEEMIAGCPASDRRR